MKSNFKTKLLAGLLLANVALFSQMNYMATSPHKLNLQNTPVAITPLYSGAPATDAYSVANSAFDVNGKLLFYIKDENVFNASGVIVGQLGGGYIGGSCEGGGIYYKHCAKLLLCLYQALATIITLYLLKQAQILGAMPITLKLIVRAVL